MPRADRRFLAAFTSELVEAEMGERARPETADWVVQRIYASGQITRFGLASTAALLAAALHVRHRAPFFALPQERRAAAARALAATRLPLAADFVRAVRALAVTHAYQADGHQR